MEKHPAPQFDQLSTAISPEFDFASNQTLFPIQPSGFRASASLLFVDAGVENAATLLQGLAPDTEVHWLQTGQDAIAQITSVLSGRSQIASIQVLSHGRSGGVQLGQSWLTAGQINSYANQFAVWQSALTQDADIVLYGCDVAEGEAGRSFVQALSQATGADVAASENLTGHGGDWILEYATGQIETVSSLSSAATQAYGGTLATFTVTNTQNDGAGSLRQAIAQANAAAGSDTIEFDTSSGSPFADTTPDQISLTSGEIAITEALTIVGTGANLLTISGENTSRIFNISAGATTSVSGLTLANGVGSLSGAVAGGGAILSAAALSIADSVFTNNQANFFGFAAGGAILSQGTLTIVDSTFSNNSSDAEGGAIFHAASAVVTMSNSTFSGNISNNSGGALLLGGTATANLTNVTLTDNTADNDADGSGDGGGIAIVGAAAVTLNNTLVAGNSDASPASQAPDIAGTLAAGGNNLVGNGSGLTGLVNGSNGNRVGTAATPIDPLLGALADNGGTTPTHALLEGSPARDAGNNALQSPSDVFDQRGSGFDRIRNGTIDIGAFEAPPPLPVISLTTATPTITEGGSAGSFIISRGSATTGALTINLEIDPASLASASDYTLTSGATTLTGPSFSVTIPDGATSVTVNMAAIAEALGVSEAAESLILNLVSSTTYTVGSSTTATISIDANGFVVTNTNDAGAGSLRQAILNANLAPDANTITFGDAIFTDATADTITLSSGELTISSSLTLTGTGANLLTISGGNASRIFNVASGTVVSMTALTIANGSANTGGGGALNAGSLTMSNSVIRNNAANGSSSDGGGIYNLGGGSLTLQSSTIRNNTAGDDGGGLRNDGTLILLSSTVNNNTAQSAGSAASGGGGLLNTIGATATITNSTFSGNIALNGGGIRNDGTLTLRSSTITNNTGTGNVGGLGNSFNVANGAAIGLTTLQNSIIAGNIDGTPAGFNLPDVGGGLNSFTDEGNNLIGVIEGFNSSINSTTLRGTLAAPANPLLAPLGDYGGTTQTHALLPGSTAINGASANATPSDQRGIAAVGTRDIGAFESRGFTIVPLAGSTPQSTTINTPFANPLAVQVSSAFAEPVAGGLISLTLTPNSNGASATLSNASIILNGSGVGDITATANNLTGSYTVSAGANGIATPTSFSLTNQLAAPTVLTISEADGDNLIPVNRPLVYTIAFSEDMDAATVNPADFANLGTASFTIGTITETTPGTFTVEVIPTSAGTVQLQIPATATIVGAVSGQNLAGTPVAGADVLTVDAIAPTVVFNNGLSSNLIAAGTTVTYTLGFSEPMDLSTITTADFSNLGTATVVIGAITATSSSTITVAVTPINNGTLQLQVPTGAVITDIAGNLLAPTADAAIVQVDGLPPTVTMEDNLTDNRLQLGGSLTYRLTFSEAITPGSFTAADLNNAGTATITIGTITAVSVGVFDVVVTPTTAGTVQLRVPTGAVIADLVGNTLLTPFTDNDLITVFDLPRITNFDGTLAYTENDVALLDTDAIVSDTDNPVFNNGSLRVELSNGAQLEDTLSVRNQGTGVGQVGVAGNLLTYNAGAGAVAIGTLTGGTNGSPFVILFGANASLVAVQGTLRNLTYTNTSDAPNPTARTVQVVLNDGSGNNSAPVSKTITITPVNDRPVLVDADVSLNIVNINAGVPVGRVGTLISSFMSLATNGNVTDPDSVATGIAITGLNASQGRWWFSLNDGANWTQITAPVTAANALLLAANPGVRLYLQPLTGGLGLISDAVTFLAWDQSSGVNGARANTTLAAANAFSLTSDTAAIAIVDKDDLVDFDKDGIEDIVFFNPTIRQAFINASKTAFGNAVGLPQVSNDWEIIKVADFDRDGNQDILWHNFRDGRNGIWSFNGLTLVQSLVLPAANPAAQILGVEDFNRDNQLDIAWFNPNTGATEIWQMNNLAVQTVHQVGSVSSNWSFEALADMNNDGFVDILWRNDPQGRVSYWAMAQFSRGSTVELNQRYSSGWSIESVNDFNADGVLDLLWRNKSAERVSIWTLDLTGAVTNISLPFATRNWDVVAVVDLENNNTFDILWRNQSEGRVGIFTLDGTNFTNRVELPNGREVASAGSDWQLVSVDDFSGDNQPDLLFFNAKEGKGEYWRLNGSVLLEVVQITPVSDGLEVI
jgi:hypothetical protein